MNWDKLWPMLLKFILAILAGGGTAAVMTSAGYTADARTVVGGLTGETVTGMAALLAGFLATFLTPFLTEFKTKLGLGLTVEQDKRLSDIERDAAMAVVKLDDIQATVKRIEAAVVKTDS